MSLYNPYFYSSVSTAIAAADYYNPYSGALAYANPYFVATGAYANPYSTVAAGATPYLATLYNPYGAYLAASAIGYPYWCR